MKKKTLSELNEEYLKKVRTLSETKTADEKKKEPSADNKNNSSNAAL